MPKSVTLHLKALFNEGALQESSTFKDYLKIRLEGRCEVNRKLLHYRLEAIFAVSL